MQGGESIKWEIAMEDEIKSLQKNKKVLKYKAKRILYASFIKVCMG